MTSPNVSSRARLSDHAIAVYLAPLFRGRRVGVAGPTSGEIAKRARALGATTVVAFGGSGEDVAVRPLTAGAIAQFRGRLDVLLVPDAGAVPLAMVLDDARHALGRDGVIAIVTQPDDGPAALEGAMAAPGPGYYALQEAVAARFDRVQMLGRGPFVAYAVATVDDPADGVVLDTTLLDDTPQPAEAFIALGSDDDVVLEAMTLVQISVDDILRAPNGAAPPAQGVPAASVDAALAKVKEAENVAADRWVKLQQMEHALKTLDDELRKARDRAARLTKDVEDERKLRQRIEIDAQMSRRAPDARSVDADALAAARDRIATLERTLTEVRAAADALHKRCVGLERELDETKSNETELRASLDSAEVDDGSLAKQRAEIVAMRALLDDERRALEQGGEMPRLEAELQARAREVANLRAQLAERDAAVRELAFSLESGHLADATTQSQHVHDQLSHLSSLHGALSAEASRIVEQNERLRERITMLEHELKQRPAAGSAGLEAQYAQTRSELAQQYALMASLEDRSQQTVLELEGARAGYTRRVAELEREIEQLVQALELVGTNSGEDAQTVDRLGHEMDVLRAERNGMFFRLIDAEASIDAQADSHDAPRGSPVPMGSMDLDPGDDRADMLLADLAATAERLASTEESLGQARALALSAERRASELERAVSELQSARAAVGGAVASEASRREAAERELLVRSLIAQLEDRDLRLRAMERRLVDEVERARRTESEIWEVELRAREQRIAMLSLEIERARGGAEGSLPGPSSVDIAQMRNALDADDLDRRRLRAAVDGVREGLSAILVDGRGAVIAHDLIALLRQLEDAVGSD